MSTLNTQLAPPEIFDVTIRDGSYVIDFQFCQQDVRLLCSSLDRMGFRYIEVGHGLGLNASQVKTAAAATDEEYLAAAAESCKQSRFGTFFIPGIGTKENLRHAREAFGMHFIRIGNEPEKYETIIPFIEYAKELGYEVMGNFMKTYSQSPKAIAEKAAVLARHGAEVIYVVDSAGGMLSDEVADYVRAIREHADVRVGFHGHNNLELAIANSLAAWQAGASLIDCSIGGLGRSAGNTRTEMLIPVLKSLGVQSPYDFHEVLRVWQEVIRPVMQRRSLTAQEIVGGYARIHSGLIGPFEKAAAAHHVSLDLLLDAYGDRLHGGDQHIEVEQLAAELATTAVPVTVAFPEPRPTESLLEIDTPLADGRAIRNTFRTVEEVLRSVKILAHKAYLPVVALVDIAAETPDDQHVMAEYFYHDDQFIVLRASFGSIASFIDVMQRHRGALNMLVFEINSAAVRQELLESESQWRRDEQVYWANLSAIKYHNLFSSLYQVAMESSAQTILFVGGNPERVANHLPPSFDNWQLYCTHLNPNALHQVGISPLEKDQPHWAHHPSSRPARFDIAVLLSPLNATELEAVLAQLNSGGVLVDCLEQTRPHLASLRGLPLRIMNVSLRTGISGELMNLQTAHASGRFIDLQQAPSGEQVTHGIITQAA